MPHRIFEQSRQRTWLAMGREKERGIKFGCCINGCCIKRFKMKSRCKLCICSFSQGVEVVFLTTSSFTVNTVRLIYSLTYNVCSSFPKGKIVE